MELGDNEYNRLKSAKILYDYIMGEEPKFTDWNVYIGILLRHGIEDLIEDVTTSDAPLLIRQHDENPKFVFNFIVNMLKTGGEIKRQEEARRKFGFVKD